MTNISFLLSTISAIFECLILLTTLMTCELRMSCCIGQRLTHKHKNSEEDFRHGLRVNLKKANASVTDVSAEQQQSTTTQVEISSTLLARESTAAPVTDVSHAQEQNLSAETRTSSTLRTVEPTAKDCTVKPWSDWSNCTGVCGAGVEFRSRAIDEDAAPGGMCYDLLLEQRPCSDPECPEACKHLRSPDERFGRWFGCATHNKPKVGCGFQIQRRKRLHMSAADKKKIFLCGPLYDTKVCENSQRICPKDLLQLNKPPSPSSIDRCYYDLWTRYSSCSSNCGPGKAIRERRVLYRHPNRTRPCKNTGQAISCERQSCIIAPPLLPAPEGLSLPVWALILISVVSFLILVAIVIAIIAVVMKMRKNAEDTEDGIVVLKQKKRASASSAGHDKET